MQQIEGIVENYLKIDTNYALMITGGWGTGKTYYLKKHLAEKIKQTPVYNNQQKKYKLILISLFGLKSIEEIQSTIFLELFSIFKKPQTKILKILAKGIVQLTGVNEYAKIVGEIKSIDLNDFIDFEELVLCFDDLERVSKHLNIEDFIGYINTLIEGQNSKVIIIANEDKIDKQNYSNLKEKVIGNTLKFIPDFKEAYDSIISDKFMSSPFYKEFLTSQKDFILKIFPEHTMNLRTLIYALQSYQPIYSIINQDFVGKHPLKNKKEEILLNLLRFTIAISIEYKEGRISFKNRNEIDSIWGINWDIANSWENTFISKEKQTEISNRDIFLNKYYYKRQYHFYSSIYNYVTGGTVFNNVLLIEELEIIYHIKKNSIEPQYEVYNRLIYPNCFSLSNSEYISLTRKMLEYAYKGEYGIQEYLSIFHFATRFKNPLNLSLAKLERNIIKGMRNGQDTYKYQEALDFYLNIARDAEYKDYLERVKQATLDLNTQIFIENQREQQIELEKLCFSNFEEFVNKDLTDIPIFAEFNTNKFYSFILKSEPNIVLKISEYFRNRYKINLGMLKAETDFLISLKGRIEKKNKKLLGKNVRGFLYQYLQLILDEAITKLNEK